MRRVRVFLRLGLRIALEWLHKCCHVVLRCAWIVDRCGLVTADCKTHCNGSMDVAGALLWEVVWGRNLVFFRVKWHWPGEQGTSCMRRVWLRSFRTRLVPPLCSAPSGTSFVRSFMRFLYSWLQIAMELLHTCCHLVLPCAARASGLRCDVAKRNAAAASKCLGMSRLRA